MPSGQKTDRMNIKLLTEEEQEVYRGMKSRAAALGLSLRDYVLLVFKEELSKPLPKKKTHK